MGVYPWHVLEAHRARILSFKNIDLSDTAAAALKARCVRDEDIIFKNQPGHRCLTTEPGHPGPPCDYYGTGVLRVVEYYDILDLYKIKANWFVKSRYELDV